MGIRWDSEGFLAARIRWESMIFRDSRFAGVRCDSIRWDSVGVHLPPPPVGWGGLGIRWDSEGFLAARIRWESLIF